MEYRPLGRTGVMVSNPCLGTMTFGWEPDDWGSPQEEALAVADASFELGINFYDTADVYARGVSETILGGWMKSKRNREKIVLATKCHGKMDDEDPNAWGNSRRHVIEACENSLRRLQTEYIDLYQIHRPQPSVPIDETLRALDDLVRSGKVRYLGASTFGAWQLAEAHYVAKSLGTNSFVCEQPPYNLLDRRVERELLPFLRTYDYACIPWSPLAGGQLSGKYLGQKPDRARYAKSDPANRVNPATRKVVERLSKVAKRHGLTMTELSLAWVANQPGVTVPIIGARTTDQLNEAVTACQVRISAKVMAEVDKVVEPGSHVLSYYTANFGPNTRP